jgi:hypothetical protein
MSFEPQIVPTLREGIDVIKMVLFRQLEPLLQKEYRQKDANFVNRLTGAVINDLFGVSLVGESIEVFAQKNQKAVKTASEIITTDLEHLRIPLTDALRIQFLCDSHEGIDSSSVLKQAQQNNILIADRDAPMPGAFMNIVRSFGRAYGILENELPAPPPANPMEGKLARDNN